MEKGHGHDDSQDQHFHPPLLALKGASLVRNGVTVFDEVSLEIQEKEFVFLVGQTGSGKSTLLRIASMDLLPTSGSVLLGKYSSGTLRPNLVPQLRRQLGFIFQDARLLRDRSVFENVAFALYVTGAKKNQVKDRVFQVLDEVGLTHKSTDLPGGLSIAEQQKVALARALVNDPLLILADEPTGNLDPSASY